MKMILKRLWGLAIVGSVVGFFVAGLRPVPNGTHEADVTPSGPTEFSLGDWKRALKAAKHAFGHKNLPALAAGVAYFSTLAFFPLMAAAVALAAFFITPDQLHGVVAAVDAYLPKDVADLIAAQLQALTGRKADNLLAAGVAIALSLFGASGASKSLISASNIAYGVKESHGWLIQQLRGLAWTAVGIVFGFTVAFLLVINGTVLHEIGIFSPIAEVLLYGRWLLMLFLITLGLAAFYRFGPNRTNPSWQWISWGALSATVLWLAGTGLFFVYVQNFGNYGKSYSFFAGIIILMVWLNLSAFTVLLGASVNHALEKTARDT